MTRRSAAERLAAYVDQNTTQPVTEPGDFLDRLIRLLSGRPFPPARSLPEMPESDASRKVWRRHAQDLRYIAFERQMTIDRLRRAQVLTAATKTAGKRP